MKKSYPTILVNICLLLAGVIFLCFFNTGARVLQAVTIILGIVFIVPSLIYLGMVCFQKAEARGAADLMGIFPAVGGLCFGATLCMRPGSFGSIIIDIISILLIALGLFHLIYLMMSQRRLAIPWGYYVAPAVIALSGVMALLPMRGNLEFLFLATGVSLILSSFTALLEGLAERRRQKQQENEKLLTATGNSAATDEQKPDATLASDAPSPSVAGEKRLDDKA